jgi:hypothetical protein
VSLLTRNGRRSPRKKWQPPRWDFIRNPHYKAPKGNSRKKDQPSIKRVIFRNGGGLKEVTVLAKNARRIFSKRIRQLSKTTGELEGDRQTTIRSDTILLEFRDVDGSSYQEVAVRLLSHPRTGRVQRRREQLLLQERLDDLVEAARELTGKAYWEACREGFVDIPGFPFSQSHRAWAQKQLAKAVNRGVAREKFTSLTLLIAVVPSVYKAPPFSDGGHVLEIIRSARVRIARTLQRAGVKVAYLNGGVEIAEHRMFEAHERVWDFVSAYRREHWPVALVAECEYVYVIHMHVGLFAHNGKDWLPCETLRPFFDSEFTLPYESWLALRPEHPAEKNAGRVAGYLRKSYSDYSDALFLEEVHLRRMVPPEDMWIEGFWCFGTAKETFALCNLRGRELTRRREIEKLEMTGAAVGFDVPPTEWVGDLCTSDEVRERKRRFKWPAAWRSNAHWRRPPVLLALLAVVVESVLSFTLGAFRK